MMKCEKYLALNTLNEYLTACSFAGSYVDITPATNQFTYLTNLEAIHLNSGLDKGHFFNFTTSSLKIGDVIEVEVELAYVAGDKGKIVIINTADANDYTQILSTNSTEQFKKLKTRFVVKKNNATYRISVGISNGTAGEIKIRGFKVKTYSSYSDPYGWADYKLKVEQRKCVLEGNASYGTKFVARSDYATDTVSINVGTEGIVCTWGTALSHTKRPVPTVTQDYAGNSYKYIARIGSVTVTGFIIRFYDANTGLLVNIADLDLSASVFVYVAVSI